MQRATRTRVFPALALAAALLVPGTAAAVVIQTGDGSGNTSAPADDPGFANVGATSTNLSAIYLGNGWVLTANHVGEVAVTLNGIPYQPIVGSKVRLANPSGPDPDLIVYRLNGFPNLPSLVLSSATPTASEEVLCVGHGWNRTASQTSWNLNWQESPPPVYRGFKQSTGKALRWGRNRVAGSGIDWGDTESFDTAFDETGGSVDEFQAVNGDSGGGCFAKRSGTWELVGVMWSRTIVPDPNDPGTDPPAQPLSTAAYTNLSIIADVAFYKNEIQVNTPPPNEIPALPPLAYGALALLIGWTARARLACGRSSS